MAFKNKNFIVLQKMRKAYPYIKTIKEMESSKWGLAWWPNLIEISLGSAAMGFQGIKAPQHKVGSCSQAH